MEPAETKHLATLQFRTDGPAVTGEWDLAETALNTYRKWIGLYGSSQHVVIRLIEETNGRRHVRKTWTRRGEVETSAAPADRD